jgi:hypothetical protein
LVDRRIEHENRDQVMKRQSEETARAHRELCHAAAARIEHEERMSVPWAASWIIKESRKPNVRRFLLSRFVYRVRLREHEVLN